MHRTIQGALAVIIITSFGMASLAEAGGPVEVKVSERDVLVRGTVSKSAVASILQAAQPDFSKCFRKVKRSTLPAGVGGALAKVKFSIGSSGAAQAATITSLSIEDRGLHNCIRKTISGLKFTPPAAYGGLAQIHAVIRFTFQAREPTRAEKKAKQREAREPTRAEKKAKLRAKSEALIAQVDASIQEAESELRSISKDCPGLRQEPAGGWPRVDHCVRNYDRAADQCRAARNPTQCTVDARFAMERCQKEWWVVVADSCAKLPGMIKETKKKRESLLRELKKLR